MLGQLSYQSLPRLADLGTTLVRILLVRAPVQTAIDQSISRPRVKIPVATISDRRKVLRTSQKVAGPGAVTGTSETEETWSRAGPGNGIGATKTDKRPRKSGPLDVAMREKSPGVVESSGGSRDRPPVLIMIMQGTDWMQAM